MRKSTGIVALGLASALTLGSAFGAHEVSTVQGLVDALTAINSGASTDLTVRLAPGTYDVSGCAMNSNGCLYVAKGIILEGTDATSWRTTSDRNAKVVLDAKYAMPVITLAPGKTVSNFRIKHVTIQNGTNTSHGAGICNGFYTGNYVTCTNCVFRGNMAVGQGGGGHTVNVYDCYFTNNVAQEGGALLASQYTWNCLMEDNVSRSNGGAFRNGTSFKDCVFLRNVGLTSSCNYGSNVTVERCVCSNNVAKQGGCFRAEKVTHNLNVKDSVFAFNGNSIANVDGGVLYNPYTVSNCVFIGSSTTRHGGSIYTETNRTIVSGCTFRNDDGSARAALNGAAVYGKNLECAPNVLDCTFTGMVATNVGGAVAYAYASNCTFTACQADKGGGAAYGSILVDCVVSNCTTTSATAGAGVSGDAGVLTGVTFVDCHCTTNETFCMAVSGSQLDDCTFLRCTPGKIVGARRCRVYGNGIYRTGDLMGGAFTNCFFTGICGQYLFSNSQLVNCTVISNNHGCTGQLFANGARVWNSILIDNFRNSSAHDIAGYGQIYLTNCVYRTHPGWTSYTLHPTDCVMTNDLSKLFLQPGEANYDPANPYRLRYGSPAKDAGFPIDWPEGATDLAGNPRICTKYARPVVDIGCYECWIPQLATWLLFR